MGWRDKCIFAIWELRRIWHKLNRQNYVLKDQDLMQKCVIAIAVSLQRFGQNADSLATVLVIWRHFDGSFVASFSDGKGSASDNSLRALQAHEFDKLAAFEDPRAETLHCTAEAFDTWCVSWPHLSMVGPTGWQTSGFESIHYSSTTPSGRHNDSMLVPENAEA